MPGVTRASRTESVAAALDVLAILAVLYGVPVIAPHVGLTSHVGSIAIVLAVALATWLLARRGQTWRSVGFARPPHLGRAAAWTLGTCVVLILVLPVVLEPLVEALNLPRQRLDRLSDLHGSTLRFLLLLVPIAWGTAAFGEELVFRGFLNTRIATALGGGRGALAIAGVAQALLFGLAHNYLGPRGVLNAFVIGLVSAAVYLADGRNLWPLIIAHGLVDTVNLLILRWGLAHG